VVDAVDAIAKHTGKSVPQVALNWVLQRPTISTVIVGARDEKQLRDNLAAAGWALTADQMAQLDKASATTPSYPYWWQQKSLEERNPRPV
jgi:aryl-alcohol dehydrogenase-like predicted oxidoreductase